MVTTVDLTDESVRAAAAARTGAPADSFLFPQALARLTRALDTEANLTPQGRVAVAGGLVSSLVTQARLAQLLTRHPEILAQPVNRPVIVTGLLRTGTTLVHNLLAEHPDLRVPALWELMNPAGERADPAAYERLADESQGYVDEYNARAPKLKHIHHLDARRPDECHRLLGNTFASMVYEMRYRVPSYGSWLRGRGLHEEYAYHRRQLQALLWRKPGGPVVLKCPFHLWSLDELLSTYPDARVVHMHRDPVATLPSTCSLCVAVREARTDQIDRAEIGRQWLSRVSPVIDDIDHTRVPVPPAQILDVSYAELMRDTVGTMARICTFAGAELTAEAETRMRRYLAQNGQAKHGVHRYRPEDFGLDTADLQTRFAAYRRRFCG